MSTTFHLYDGLDEKELQINFYGKSTTHQGLRFTKFFGRWARVGSPELLTKPGHGNNSTRTEPLLDWLNPVCEPGARKEANNETLKIGEVDQLESACQRIENMTDKIIRSRFGTDAFSIGATFKCSLVSRLLTGIGLPHPSENGFLFHPTLAVPYLRGTALKQVARDWAESEEGVLPSELDRLFGRADCATVAGNVGCLTFLDALPTSPVILTGEQITNHYQPYYENVDPLAMQGQRDDIHQPGDWHEPKPVCLLAVDASFDVKLPFVFGILPMGDASLDDVRNVASWLRSGLEIEGVGARTTVGYGRLVRDREEEKKSKERIAGEESARREALKKEVLDAMTQQKRSVFLLQEALDSEKWKTDDKSRNELNERFSKLGKSAVKWPELAERVYAADVIERWYDATNWGKKEPERRELIITLRKPKA